MIQIAESVIVLSSYKIWLDFFNPLILWGAGDVCSANLDIFVQSLLALDLSSLLRTFNCTLAICLQQLASIGLLFLHYNNLNNKI